MNTRSGKEIVAWVVRREGPEYPYWAHQGAGGGQFTSSLARARRWPGDDTGLLAAQDFLVSELRRWRAGRTDMRVVPVVKRARTPNPVYQATFPTAVDPNDPSAVSLGATYDAAAAELERMRVVFERSQIGIMSATLRELRFTGREVVKAKERSHGYIERLDRAREVEELLRGHLAELAMVLDPSITFARSNEHDGEGERK
jgi:hypothetical protein